jgi:hypothetical protein
MSNGYISMLVVAEGHRAAGSAAPSFGTRWADNDQMTWVLRAMRHEGVQAFYASLGFRLSEVAMERPGANAKPLDTPHAMILEAAPCR